MESINSKNKISCGRDWATIVCNSKAEVIQANRNAIEWLGLKKYKTKFTFPTHTQKRNHQSLQNALSFLGSDDSGPVGTTLLTNDGSILEGFLTVSNSSDQELVNGWFLPGKSNDLEYVDVVRRLVGSKNTPENVAEDLLRYLLKVAGGAGIFLHVADFQKKRLQLANAIGIAHAALQELRLMGFSEGVAGEVIHRKERMIIEDLRTEKARLKRIPDAILERYSVRSLWAFPLIVDDRVIGVLSFAFVKDIKRPTPVQEGIISILSSYLALVIYKTQIEARERKYFSQLSVLRELPEIWRQSNSLDELFVNTAQLVVERLNFWDMGFFQYIPLRDVLKKVAAAGELSNAIPDDYEQSVNVGVLGWVVRNGKTRYVPDTSKEEIYYPFPQYKNHSELAIPLKIGEQIFGVLNMESDQVDGFDDIDIWTMETLAQNLALYLEHSRLLDLQRIRAENLAVINRIANFLNSTIEFDEIISGFCNQLSQLLGLYYVSIHRFYQDKYELEKIASAGGGKSQRALFERVPADIGVLGWVAQNRRSLYVPDITLEPLYVPVGDRDMGSEYCLPIVTGDELFGVLNIESLEKNAFDSNLRIVIHSITEHFAQSLRNAILFRQIRQEKGKSEAILTALTEGVIIVSPSGSVSFANRAAKVYFPDIQTEKPRDAEKLPFWQESLKRPFQNGRQISFEWEGEGRIWAISKISMGEADDLDEFLLLFEDVTEKKKLERRRIEHDRLQVAVKVAGSVAHELNQPLTGILGYCSLLLEDLDEDSDLYKDIKLIEEQANRIAGLIHKFQNVVRLRTKPYLQDTEILDIDQSGGEADESNERPK